MFALCNYKIHDNVKLKADSQQFILEVDSNFPKLKIFLDASLKLTFLVGRVELQFGLCLLSQKTWEGIFVR